MGIEGVLLEAGGQSAVKVLKAGEFWMRLVLPEGVVSMMDELRQQLLQMGVE